MSKKKFGLNCRPQSVARCRAAIMPAVIAAVSVAKPAWALSGAIDPATGMSQLAPWFLGLCESAIVIMSMYKGVHAVGEGRSLGPILIASLGGTLLCVGGYYVLQHMGVSTTM